MKNLILAILVSVASSAIVPTKPGDCNVKTADIAFIVDASGSVSDSDWTKSLAFIAKLVEGFDIGTNAVRVAAMQFSGTPRIMFDFNAHSDVTKLKAAILGMGKISGGTQTDAALDLARMQLFTSGRGMRNGVPHLLFVITDGESNSRPLTAASAQKLHQLGLTVFAMGVGRARLDELKAIASSPTYVYTISDYSKLAQIQQQFQKETCEVAVKLVSTTVPVPTKKDCVIKKADIGFILDGSGSVDSTEWTKSIEFVSKLVQGFDVSKDGVHVGLIEYSYNAQMVFNFNTYQTQASLLAALAQAPKTNGNTYTNRALDMARTNLLTQAGGARPGLPNILFVITDGQSTDPAATIASAKLLHQQGATVFAVGVKGAQQAELLAIASHPRYVYTSADYNKLDEIRAKFAQEACEVAEQLVSSVTTPVPPKATPAPGCTVNNVDVVFAVDTSSSVGEGNFNLTKTFLLKMMETLDFSNIRVGIIKFNDKVTTEFSLNENNNLVMAQSGISKMQYDSGSGTVISGALKHMREVSFQQANGDRPAVPNVGVVVTDGQAKDPYRTQYEANKTKEENIQLFTVGIGNEINDNELRSMASQPSFFYPVQSFYALTQIKDRLANMLCQGFTLPPSTTQAQCFCQDKQDCEGQGYNRNEVCLESRYRDFAKENCPVFCDLCEPGCIEVRKPPPKCIDKISDCANKIGVCDNPAYKKYALDNCCSYCQLAHELITPRWTQPPTTPSTTPKPTTSTPTTTSTTTMAVPVKPTPFTPCDPNCYDKERNCAQYDEKTCRDDRYIGFYKNNCAEYCGFCTPIPACVKKCQDKPEAGCSGYADDQCVDYPGWAKNDCPMRCGLCPGGIPVTKAPFICEDKEDCRTYGKDVCTDYKDFAKKNCAVFCNFCTPLNPMTTPKCIDKRDCSGYKKEFCVDPDYRFFMLNECRLYCGLCGVELARFRRTLMI